MTELFAIQSDTSQMPIVEERLFHYCQEMHVGNYFSTICVAVMQAVENAIKHGNRGDNTCKVEVEMGTYRGGVYVEVADQGQGFDYNQYGSLPLEGASMGEGIFIMNQLADKVEYKQGGCVVRMEFAVAGIDPAEAMERRAVWQHYMATVPA